MLRPRAPEHAVTVDDLTANWDYCPSRPALLYQGRRLARAAHRVGPPAHIVLRPFLPAARWTVYFAYCPAGSLDAAQRFTIRGLRTQCDRLGVIIATPDVATVSAEELDAADAIVWKSLDGFDLSAYAIVLDLVTRFSAGADLLIVNDSLLGPFGDMSFIWERARWDVTGLTAYSYVENHVQSYLLAFRDVQPATVAALDPALSPRWAYDDYSHVVFRQETMLARTAHRNGLRVGALWYGDGTRAGDPSLWAAASMLREGSPFLKRALFSKHRGVHSDAGLAEILAAHSHPDENDWLASR